MDYTDFHDKILDINRELNLRAEVSWDEEKTTKYIEKLFKEDFDVKRFNKTGLYIKIPGQIDKTIAFRSDIDALPYNFKDGLKVIHACGHDAHMTTLIGILFKLKITKYQPIYNLLFIFQPAEEAGSGAKYVLEHDILDDVEYMFGMHVRPKNELKGNEFSSSIQHGASATLHVDITTTEGHAGRPWESINSIDIAMDLNQQIKALCDPYDRSFSVKMTTIETLGGTHNTIPGTVNCVFDVRAQYNEMMQKLQYNIDKICERVLQAYDCTLNYYYTSNTVAADISDDAKNILTEVLKEQQHDYIETIVTPGAEDFHTYSNALPEIKTTMLGIGCNMNHGLHHPEMKYDKESIFTAINIYFDVIKKLDKKVS
ncbi:amidohydrolase [Macrococcoides caseolyticum]|uniref:amidohydrolase n=1 Tax=Macrococcoides caseolyticum TaxID=69966 RepID=UPI001F249342|nr:amidohydrolase [Macrococcus caseolyticus]MCE4956208.1 amidohydrolase [Macrococcus caseolyticus]